MANVYKSTISQWNNDISVYEYSYTEYFTSKKKAIANAVSIIRILDEDEANIEIYKSFIGVSNKKGFGRSYFITKEYVA